VFRPDRRHAEDTMSKRRSASFLLRRLLQVIDDAVQIWGGEGYMRSNGLERLLRDARIKRGRRRQ